MKKQELQPYVCDSWPHVLTFLHLSLLTFWPAVFSYIITAPMRDSTVTVASCLYAMIEGNMSRIYIWDICIVATFAANLNK